MRQTNLKKESALNWSMLLTLYLFTILSYSRWLEVLPDSEFWRCSFDLAYFDNFGDSVQFFKSQVLSQWGRPVLENVVLNGHLLIYTRNQEYYIFLFLLPLIQWASNWHHRYQKNASDDTCRALNHFGKLG